MHWALLSILAAGAMAGADQPHLDSVPQPSLVRLDPVDRDRVQAARARLEHLLAQEATQDRDLATAFGELGGLFLLHDLLLSAGAALDNARMLAPDDVRWNYYRCVVSEREGKLMDAEHCLGTLVSRVPTHLGALIRRGRILLQLGLIEEAEGSFRAALEIQREAAAAYHGLGTAAYERGDWQTAIAHLERALAIQPEASSIHHLLGLAHRRLGNRQRAQEHLRRNRYGVVSFADPMMDALDATLAAETPYVRAGVQAIDAGDFDRGLGLLRQAIDIAPDDAFAQYSLARGLLLAGRPGESVARFRTAVSLDPRLRDAHVGMAVALRRTGRFGEALKSIELAVELDPMDHNAKLEQATILARAGRSDDARRVLDAVLEQAPSYLRATRARTHLQRGTLAVDNDPAAAESDFRRATELAPEFTSAHLSLGRLLLRRRELAGAVQSLEAAVALEPGNGGARRGLAYAHLLSGHDAAALGVLELGVELSPTDERLLHLLARVLATSRVDGVRDPERALTLARQVASDNPSVDHLEDVAMAHAALADFEQAVSWQRLALEAASKVADPVQNTSSQDRLELYLQKQPVLSPWLAVTALHGTAE